MSPKPVPEQSMRARLLKAGRDALIEEGYRLLEHGLKIDHIIQRAGVTSQTFHNHFPNKKDVGGGGSIDNFRDELMSALIADQPRVTPRLLGDAIAQSLAQNNGEPRKAIRQVCQWDFVRVRSDPATRIRLFVAAFARDHAAAVRAVRADYAEINGISGASYEAILARWGATLRKPFTTDSIAVLFSALVEGLALRWLVDPDAVPDELFGEAVIALTSAVVDVEQHHEHIDDVIAPLADEVMREFRLSQSEDRLENPRQAIIEAAKIEFARRGFFSTDLTHIATTAGVELRMVKRLFRDKATIVVAALKSAFDDLKDQVSDNISIGRSAPDVVTRYLERLATLFIDNRAMSDALLLVVTHDTMQAPETTVQVKEELNFPALIEPTIEAGQQSGVFSATTPASEIAAMLVNMLLLRCFTRRDQTPQQITAVVSSMFFDGIRVPRTPTD